MRRCKQRDHTHRDDHRNADHRDAATDNDSADDDRAAADDDNARADNDRSAQDTGAHDDTTAFNDGPAHATAVNDGGTDTGPCHRRARDQRTQDSGPSHAGANCAAIDGDADAEFESTALGVWPVVGIIAAGAVVLAAGVVCFIKRRHMRGSTTVHDDPLTPTHAAGAAVFETYTDGTTPTAVDTAPRFQNENDSYMEEPRRPQLWESTLESQPTTSFVSDSHGSAFDSFVSRSSTGNDTFVR
ncbi:hypothetical protein SPRG_20978 [Saprolegnia parasitica CBS 223.65]|uniref:Uncharacterized protein n=1 Tax=Saprolegnia parasitica (strain CBS 223.65) TaxID=695850 RepID=A0A067C8V9_SAPPC|nr:hypothetical protein SPRG_20978 [Saprolegnia parasitica CBS 223.65]KDO23217.1 hypothetical protein SPRG_20978 [Saprolegnia parasitica CBS 223.65]|eukprot:XP_012206067.1 hypothetical protein SPRG_20978 [Saprolegnia parasitica CBS 223.65]